MMARSRQRHWRHLKKSRIRRTKVREVHDQEGEVMGKKICLTGNSEPPDENMDVTFDESFSDDKEKASFYVMWKEV